MRKVVFEGVHLLGDIFEVHLQFSYLPSKKLRYHVVDRDEGIVDDLDVEAGLERRPQDEPPDLLEAVDSDLGRQDLARQILLLRGAKPVLRHRHHYLFWGRFWSLYVVCNMMMSMTGACCKKNVSYVYM